MQNEGQGRTDQDFNGSQNGRQVQNRVTRNSRMPLGKQKFQGECQGNTINNCAISQSPNGLEAQLQSCKTRQAEILKNILPETDLH